MYSQRVYENLVKQLQDDAIPLRDAFDVTHLVVKIVYKFDTCSREEKNRIIIATIEDIVAGKDGILYTDDDLLPPHIIDGLRALINSNILLSTVDFICEVTHVKSSCTLCSYICSFFCCCKDLFKKHEPLLQ